MPSGAEVGVRSAVFQPARQASSAACGIRAWWGRLSADVRLQVAIVAGWALCCGLFLAHAWWTYQEPPKPTYTQADIDRPLDEARWGHMFRRAADPMFEARVLAMEHQVRMQVLAAPDPVQVIVLGR